MAVRPLVWFACVLASLTGLAAAKPKPMPADTRAYFTWPGDGQVISGRKFWVRTGLSGAGAAPAGVETANTGHHHLLVDSSLLDDITTAIPNDRNHLHFGAGQTETMLELPPGKHTLQLLISDGDHVPHDPPVYSSKITTQVRPGPAARTAAAQ